MAYNQQFCYAQACRGTHIHMYVVDVARCQTRSLWAIQGVKRLIKRNLQHLCNTHTYTHTHLAQLLAHPIVRLQFSCSAIRFHAYPSIHPSTQPFIHIQFHQNKAQSKIRQMAFKDAHFKISIPCHSLQSHKFPVLCFLRRCSFIFASFLRHYSFVGQPTPPQLPVDHHYDYYPFYAGSTNNHSHIHTNVRATVFPSNPYTYGP